MGEFILLIEDEPSIAQNIAHALEGDGFTVKHARRGDEALELAAHENPRLAIVDLGLPDKNGFEVARALIYTHKIPVIFLTARGSEVDRVSGLELGADDYLVKPVSLRELCARVRTVMRRTDKRPTAQSPVITKSAHFEVDDARKSIFFRGHGLSLSRTEYQLLLALLKNRGRVLSREQLMNLAWEDAAMSLERTVDAHVKAIRAKLSEIAPDEEVIVTHRGFGYSLKD